jgi:hypothetical protein
MQVVNKGLGTQMSGIQNVNVVLPDMYGFSNDVSTSDEPEKVGLMGRDGWGGVQGSACVGVGAGAGGGEGEIEMMSRTSVCARVKV